MAERFDSIYDLPGSLEDQLDELQRFVQELAITNPTTEAPPIPQRNPARSPIAELSDPLTTTPIPRTCLTASPPYSRYRSASRSSPTSNYILPISTHKTPSSPPTSCRKCVSELNFGGSSARDSTSSYASSTSSEPSRDSLNSRHTSSVSKTLPLPRTPELSEPVQPRRGSLSLLPPPAIQSPSSHLAHNMERARSNSTLSPFPAQQDSIMKLHRSSTTASQKATFEKEAFRNSAVLCDL